MKSEGCLWLFLFMPILAQTLFTFMRRHFMSFTFLSAWHTLLVKNSEFRNYLTLFFTSLTNTFAGLNEGML